MFWCPYAQSLVAMVSLFFIQMHPIVTHIMLCLLMPCLIVMFFSRGYHCRGASSHVGNSW